MWGKQTAVVGAILALTTGCYAELYGGAYAISADDANGVTPKSTGYGVGINAGVYYDPKQTVRVFAGGGQGALPPPGEADGPGAVAKATGGQVRADYQFAHWKQQHTAYVTVGGGYGNVETTYKRGDMDETKGTGSGALNLTGGIGMTLPYNYKPHWFGHISVGGDLWRMPSEIGDVSAIGAVGRIIISYSPFVWIRNKPAE